MNGACFLSGLFEEVSEKGAHEMLTNLEIYQPTTTKYIPHQSRNISAK